MPPPEPRSRTVSPGLSSASAVGLPQPSEARTACSGIALVSAASYRFDVTGSPSAVQRLEVPQQELLAGVRARSAASPYFSLTTSLMSVAIRFSYLQHPTFS